MTKSPIPTFRFSPKHLTDIPFQIIHFEKLPAVAIESTPRRRAFYEIFWITDGVGKHHIDFEGWSIIPNTLYFITPGQVAYWELQEQAKGFAILFTQEFMASNLLEQVTLQSFDFYHHTTQQPLIHIDNDDAKLFTAICEHMVSEYNGQNYGRFALLQCQLITFLIHSQRHYNELLHPSHMLAGDKLVKRYLQLIDKHFHEIKTILDYAEILSVTSGHLSDMVGEHLGTTPIQLLNKRIALEAKRELIHSEQTIAEVSLVLNFDNPSYFSRFFKREVGIAPSEFRRKFREKYQYPRP